MIAVRVPRIVEVLSRSKDTCTVSFPEVLCA